MSLSNLEIHLLFELGKYGLIDVKGLVTKITSIFPLFNALSASCLPDCFAMLLLLLSANLAYSLEPQLFAITLIFHHLSFRSTSDRDAKHELQVGSLRIVRHLPGPYFSIPFLRETSSYASISALEPPSTETVKLFLLPQQNSCCQSRQ